MKQESGLNWLCWRYRCISWHMLGTVVPIRWP